MSRERYKQYYYVINGALSEAARQVFDMFSEKFARRIDDMMVADVTARSMKRGKAEGLAGGTLTVLRARGLALTEAQRDLITGTTDLTQLNRWRELAATVTTADALFT